MILTIIGVTLLSLVILLYGLLALGAPLGFLALGGKHKGVLPKKERIQVVVSIPAQLFALFVLLNLGTIFGSEPGTIITVFGHIFMIYFLLNTGLNLLSKSRYERLIMSPIALYVSFCYVYVLYLQ